MFWRKIGGISLDAFVILAGLTIATPFFLILASPFLGGL